MSPEKEASNADLYGTTPAIFKAALKLLQTEFETGVVAGPSNKLQGGSASAERIAQKDLYGTASIDPVAALDLEDSSEIQQSGAGEKLSPALRKLIGGIESERARESRVSKAARAMGSTARELTGVFDAISYGRPPPKEAILEVARESVKSNKDLVEHRRNFFAEFVTDIVGLRKTGKDQWVATVALVWDHEKGRDERLFVDVPIDPEGNIIGDARKATDKPPLTRAMVRELITYDNMGFERPNDAVQRAAFKGSDRPKDWAKFNDTYADGEATLQAMRPAGDGRFLVKVGFSWTNTSESHVRQYAYGWAMVNDAGKVVER